MRALDRLHRFWFVELDPWILGLFRVCLGAFVLVYLAMLAPSWREFYGPGSISPVPHMAWRDYRPFFPLLSFVSSPTGLWLFYGASVLAAVALAAGLWVRPAVIWLWLSMVSLTFASRVNNGEEQVLSILLFFAMFLPLGASFRFDQLFVAAGRRDLLEPAGKVAVSALTVLQVHVIAIYVVSLPAKLSDPAWLDGTAVYYAMMAMDYPRWPGIELFAWNDANLSRVMSWSTLALEGLLPFTIWSRRLRVVSALVLIGLHLGLGVLLEGIMMFNGAMIVALVLFLPSGRTRATVRELVRGTNRSRTLLDYLIARS